MGEIQKLNRKSFELFYDCHTPDVFDSKVFDEQSHFGTDYGYKLLIHFSVCDVCTYVVGGSLLNVIKF